MVDAAMPFGGGTDKNDTRTLFLAEPDPWPDPVDGCALLDEIVEAITRFVRAPPELTLTVVLWIVFSHTFESFECRLSC